MVLKNRKKILGRNFVVKLGTFGETNTVLKY